VHAPTWLGEDANARYFYLNRLIESVFISETWNWVKYCFG
jgi:hypothetical protein